MDKLKNKIIKIRIKELQKLPVNEILICVEDFVKLKCTDLDGDAPFGLLLNCLSKKDKDYVIDYILKLCT